MAITVFKFTLSGSYIICAFEGRKWNWESGKSCYPCLKILLRQEMTFSRLVPNKWTCVSMQQCNAFYQTKTCQITAFQKEIL